MHTVSLRVHVSGIYLSISIFTPFCPQMCGVHTFCVCKLMSLHCGIFKLCDLHCVCLNLPTSFGRGTSLGIYLMTTASMAAFTFTLNLKHIWISFVTGGLLGYVVRMNLSVGVKCVHIFAVVVILIDLLGYVARKKGYVARMKGMLSE